MPTIEIDGKKIEAEAGTMLIQAADAAGITIPRFCYHEKLSIAANCRMCLVEVEKAPKPVPACATPVVDGMKVYTRSPKAIDAQKGTMEFLLINHPLDCPICDQGGECPLQDLAVGYGGDVSRFAENKRVVVNKNIGPLIATEMTRCIHCTRCVRFGSEIAGIMELGATGRGEHMEIGTYVAHSVDSELSGNMIDICPVGALTSKPFRFAARSWELTSVESVSPHDCVGANLYVQALRNQVRRVLPRRNEAVNETWLADRDRFSYEAVNSPARLTAPRQRTGTHWRDIDWTFALETAVDGLKRVRDRHGPASIGALAAPTATLEELYLLQKLLRALGSDNVDHRLRQLDFSDDADAPLFPYLGGAIADLERRQAVLLVGSNLRKEQPLLAHRLRKGVRKGASVMAINPLDYDFAFPLAHKSVVAPEDMPRTLAAVAKVLADKSGRAVPDQAQAWFAALKPGAADKGMAEALLRAGAEGTVLLGNLAGAHPQFARLRALAELVADLCGAQIGCLPEANGAGAWLAGCVPHRGPLGAAVAKPGRNAAQMLHEPLKAYILLGAEPELDSLNGRAAQRAMQSAEFVLALSAFQDAAAGYAHLQLPAAPFTETSGSFVNCEGRVQSFTGAVPPRGEARPGWKILRVLGNLLDLPGFDYTSSAEVRADIDLAGLAPAARLRQWRLDAPQAPRTRADIDLERVLEVPMYAVDALVRRAPALQETSDNAPPAVRVGAADAKRLGLADGVAVSVHMGEAMVRLNALVDARVPAGCAWIPAGCAETAALGGAGLVRLVRA